MKKPELSGQVSDEFFLRVNDFIETANRIERRFDSGHAQVVLLHACARYGAHHYRSTVSADSAAERVEFANYLGNQIAQLVMNNIEQLAGPAPGAEPSAAE